MKVHLTNTITSNVQTAEIDRWLITATGVSPQRQAYDKNLKCLTAIITVPFRHLWLGVQVTDLLRLVHAILASDKYYFWSQLQDRTG